MPTDRLRRALELAGLAALCVSAAALGYSGARAQVTAVAMESGAGDALLPGPPIVRVFDDYECAACELFDRRVADRLRRLEQEGRIRLRYHHAPVATHVKSGFAAAAVLCTPPEDRYRVRRALHRDRRWAYADDPERAVAGATSSDATDALLACMRSDSIAATLQEDEAFVRRAGIRRVPTIWVRGSMLRFRSYSSLLNHLDVAL